MKRMIGFLVVVGLMMGVGCGSDDDNPVNSNRDLLVGTWLYPEVDALTWSLTLNSDGTFHANDEGDDVDGTWSLEGDQLTFDPTDKDSETATLVSVTDTELTITWVGVEEGQPGETLVYTRQTPI